MDWLLDNAWWLWFGAATLINLGVNAYEKNALARGRDQLERTVMIRGILTLEGGEILLMPNTFGKVVRTFLWNDLRGVGPWMMWLLAAMNIGVGIYFDDLISLGFGGAVLLLYGRMLVRTIRSTLTSEIPPPFDADLVELSEPTFLGLAPVKCRLATGEVFTNAVRWRPTRALLNRGPVVLVFRGRAEQPAKGSFVGIRPN